VIRSSVLACALGLLVVATGGCGKSKPKAAVSSAGDAGATAPPPPVVIDAAAPAIDAAPAAAALTAREDGVGPLGEKSDVSEAALTAAFPGYTVKKVSQSQGGDLREEYVAISKGDTLLLKVELVDTTLAAIAVVSPDVPNPMGIKVGATHAEVVAALGPLDCADGGATVDWRADVVECGNARTGRYSLDFQATDGTSAEDLLADADALAGAKLTAITWQATQPGPPPR